MVRRFLRVNGCGAGLVLAVLSQAAAAWGPLGHRAFGGVADALLTPSARVEVARLLADDHDRDGRPSGRTTLAEASLWADEIRGTGADRPTWHYDNMPVCGAIPSDRAWCSQQQCGSARLGPLLAQLADRDRSTTERRDALKWIAHLVGDLHQPLHAADYAQGGNLIHVELAGRSSSAPWTLHAAWDVRLVASALHAGTAQRPPESALRSLIARARKVSKEEREAPVSQWLAESNRLARQVALDYPQFACQRPPGPSSAPVRLSVEYQRLAQRVITSQLALAGARLATILNRTLTEP
jgi:hypothetical protein